MDSKKDAAEDFGSSVVPQDIQVSPRAKCHYPSDLPREFVTYIYGRNRTMRYSRIANDSWDEWIWNGEWIFSDNVGPATALDQFLNAEHVAVLIR